MDEITGPEPRLLMEVGATLAAAPPEQRGALWRLAEPGRQLDANLVRLPPGARVAAHAEGVLDVLLLAVAGSGSLRPEPIPAGGGAETGGGAAGGGAVVGGGAAGGAEAAGGAAEGSTEAGGARSEEIALAPGAAVWLPRGSRRSLSAGPDGLAYLTVHQRRPGLAVGPRPA